MVEEEAEQDITILLEEEKTTQMEEQILLDQISTALETIQEHKITEQDLRLTLEILQEITHQEHLETIIILLQETIVLHQEQITTQYQEATITIQLLEVLQEVVLEAAHQEVEVVLEVEDLEVVEVN